MSFEDAVTLVFGGLTAHAFLKQASLRPGAAVLVNGASGAVGTAAVQLAAHAGAHVTGVCSTGKLDLVRSIGADDVIDYTREGITDGGQRYDVVIDTAGNRPLSQLRRALAPRGTLVLVGGEGGDRWIGGMDRQLRALALSPFVRQQLTMKTPKEHYVDLERLAQLIEAGQLTPIIDKTYPLHQAPDAMRHLQAGHARGKIVITVIDAG
jgi:NADPH:quinone reductase-like Zn-dependent oxidoreductase